MSPSWKTMVSRKHKRGRRALNLHGVHAKALRRQLVWARDFALVGDLASALDALGDAGALAQELGRRIDGAGLAQL